MTSGLRGWRQEDCWKYKASLVYTVSLRAARKHSKILPQKGNQKLKKQAGDVVPLLEYLPSMRAALGLSLSKNKTKQTDRQDQP